MADDLTGLPDTYMFTAQHDVLRDDGFLYAHWLREAGVKVKHGHSKYGFHGMFSIRKGVKMLNELELYYNEFIQFLNASFKE